MKGVHLFLVKKTWTSSQCQTQTFAEISKLQGNHFKSTVVFSCFSSILMQTSDRMSDVLTRVGRPVRCGGADDVTKERPSLLTEHPSMTLKRSLFPNKLPSLTCRDPVTHTEMGNQEKCGLDGPVRNEKWDRSLFADSLHCLTARGFK